MPIVTIDGIEVHVEKGATVLDAARKAGVWIPTLCYHPAVEGNASCRLCLVELDRGEWTQLITACNYPVRRDLRVSVSSPKATKARRGVMQLLLARAPDSEQLKALAERMGVEGTPYPKVTESQRNCILCGLCVAVCEEVMGPAGIGFAGRGVERAVAPPFRQASEVCTACGACAAICPVGTIQLRLHEDTKEMEVSPFKSRSPLGTCERCGALLSSEPVTAEALQRSGIAREEYRRRIRLCPQCRRREAVRQGTAVRPKRRAPTLHVIAET